MSPEVKLSLDVALKYFEIINSQMEDLHRRLYLAETVIKETPELVEKYQQAEKDSAFRSSPSLNRQLSAFRQTLEKIR